jgi:inositol phosphorylceramide mannosyltransferase catalytic subunit
VTHQCVEAAEGDSYMPGATVRWLEEREPDPRSCPHAVRGRSSGAVERERARTQSELSNLTRYEVLHRYGGVYVDTDVECLRPLTALLGGIDAFAALEVPERIGTAILGSVAGHPVFERAARLARQTFATGTHSTEANGPYFLTLILEQEQNVAIFGAELFYPYLWDEPERRHEKFPDAYAVHHWALSWLGENKPG